MKKFRKKPVTIEAIQWTGICLEDAEDIGKQLGSEREITFTGDGTMYISTLEGVMAANKGDWIIKGVQGEIYPCKPDIFEETYGEDDGCMTFGLAIEALKMGKKVARIGWNGKDMWLAYMSGMSLPPFGSQIEGKKVNDRTAELIGEDTPLVTLPYIAMWTADQKWLPGWLASQTDILAEDWVIVD
jgi:hypothetical protein